MQYDINGKQAYAYTGGKTFDAKLPTVVFVHGAQCDHSVWILQSRYLAHHGYGVLAVDLPGHGRSEAPALASVGELADWVTAVQDAAGVKQAAIINIRRHVLKHGEARFADLPCTKKGVCVDCVHPQRLCHYTVIIEGEAGYHRTVSGDPHRIHVIIVGEELGI